MSRSCANATMTAVQENPVSSTADAFKPLYKQHRRLSADQVSPEAVFCSTHAAKYQGPYTICSHIEESTSYDDCVAQYVGESPQGSTKTRHQTVFTVKGLPGLKIFPSAFAPEVQNALVDDVVKEFLGPKTHLTNLDAHYHVPRPLDLFGDDSQVLPHKEAGRPGLTLCEAREKKLRWVTLGGQYDWTAKVYPTFEKNTEEFPMFPKRLGALLGTLFDIECEAAIVNFYSPGDTLSPHQDVAELSRADLVSVSLGCDCIFYVGKSRSHEPMAIYLQSGDIIVMGGESRHAFHGVGRVFPNTCPSYLSSSEQPEVARWVGNKRININVRQVL